MREDTYYRNHGKRAPNSRRYHEQYNNSSGNGWLVVGMIGLIIIGMYFFLEDEQKAKVTHLVDEVKVQIEQLDLDFLNAFTDTIEGETGQTKKAIPLLAQTLCTQSNAVKVLSYTLLDLTEISESEVGEAWYQRYYEALKQDARFDFLKEENAMNPITYEEAQYILTTALGDAYQIRLQMDEKLAKQYITIDTFLKSYQKALTDSGQAVTFEVKELSILGTPATHSELDAWTVATNEGVYGFEGLILDLYIDQKVTAIVKNNEILGVIDLINEESVIEACFIEKVNDHTVTVAIDGMKFVYTSDVVTQADEGQQGVITLYNSKIIDYKLQVDTNADTLIRMTEDTLEFEKGGSIPYDELLIYNGIKGADYSDKTQLFSGIKATYTLKDGKINTLKVVDDTLGDDVRILLSSDGLGNYNHEKVELTSEVDCLVTYGETKMRLRAGDRWDLDTFEWQEESDKLIITPEEDAPIQITSMTRQKEHPKYEGKLEIYKDETSYKVINVLDREEYVVGVIPSEMPESYGLEAAKVQAVAARSYAVANQKSSKFVSYGAQLDDTTASQVYNNVRAGDVAEQAVAETEGEVMRFEDKVVSGNFFATSCGYTANYGETWSAGEVFPTHTPTYLTSEQQYSGLDEIVDFTNEEEAYRFFTASAKEIDAFDADSPWFRWEVALSGEELSHIINSNIERLTMQYPNMVKVLSENEDKWESGTIETIGGIKDIRIEQRGDGGNIMELVVSGEEGAVKVSTEYLIRCLLAPIQKDSSQSPIQVTRADGSVVENMMMLPSAFFVMDMNKEDSHIVDMTLYGGGFGHGVGMSQDGVKGMVERGFEYDEILEHYYNDVEIEVF